MQYLYCKKFPLLPVLMFYNLTSKVIKINNNFSAKCCSITHCTAIYSPCGMLELSKTPILSLKEIKCCLFRLSFHHVTFLCISNFSVFTYSFFLLYKLHDLLFGHVQLQVPVFSPYLHCCQK